MRTLPGCSTGICASIGRTCSDSRTVQRVIEAGANNIRFALGLRDRDFFKDLEVVCAAAEAAGQEVDFLFDLPSTRPRVGVMPTRRFQPGDRVLIKDQERDDGTGAGFIPVPGIRAFAAQMKRGDRVFFRDNHQEFRLQTDGHEPLLIAECVECAEPIQSCVGCSFPDSDMVYKPISAQDAELMRGVAERGLRPAAVVPSFITGPEPLTQTRAFVDEVWPGGGVEVFAKFEVASALDIANDLISVADGGLIGRGDLGMSLAPEQLPRAQRQVAEAARAAGKPFLVASQILERYAATGVPYRAELSDISLSIQQGARILVLCQETNDSQRPVEAVAMARRVIEAEAACAS